MSKAVAPPHGNTLYPWARWSNGEWHKAVQGKHFARSVKSFTGGLWVWGKRNGKRPETRVSGKTVWLRFTDTEL